MGCKNLVSCLLDNGADANLCSYTNGVYETAFHAACVEGHLEIAKLLVEHGAIVNADPRIRSSSVLGAVCRKGYLGVILLLLENGAKINEGYPAGLALHEACEAGNIDVVRLLIERGADINLRGRLDGTALQAACSGRHLHIADLLIEKGADVNSPSRHHGSALHVAVKACDPEMVNFLIQNDADVNARGGIQQQTVLEHLSTYAAHIAELRGDFEQIERLLKNAGAQ